MTVATVGPEGRPSTRIVLIKGFDEHGFVWYTNYESRKGQELAVHPFAALQFHWVELERVVRIEGRVEKTKTLAVAVPPGVEPVAEPADLNPTPLSRRPSGPPRRVWDSVIQRESTDRCLSRWWCRTADR